ncbi:cyclic nucleotide-binding protein [Leptolyngbya sp. 'hensonii']|uniref:cyclic nucleotide-binding domain-containing protein n=1 Tax=Leptolyngbya sp. 'hensonii' TaxID=1922337 RepID=UPI00094FA7D5|nr:cyclic nucleotide-binding domain-containing protein [Leptolyngbya sp. 'hensonii']OLP16154.1 cyclic nucleotide-binding protein [Leptolyngbya sp. 'hensonii']
MKKVLFILGELSDEDFDWMVYVGRREEIPTGTILIQEGEEIDALYIVLKGTLAVSVDALGGQEIARLSVGEVVGEMSFIDSHLPSATVEAIEPSLVLSIPLQQLNRKLNNDLGFASRLYRSLAFSLSDRLRETVSHLGYGKEPPQQERSASTNDLNPHVLENLDLAVTRFESLVRRLRGY